MAKPRKDKGPPPGETPFQKMELLAKALVAVSREQIQQQKKEKS
jgi:hypothetical protein